MLRFDQIGASFERELDDASDAADEVDAVCRALRRTLALLREQERIRESVPVRSPEPGPTLAEQIEHMRRVSETWRLTDGGEAWHMRKAILASLERLARSEDDNK